MSSANSSLLSSEPDELLSRFSQKVRYVFGAMILISNYSSCNFEQQGQADDSAIDVWKGERRSTEALTENKLNSGLF